MEKRKYQTQEPYNPEIHIPALEIALAEQSDKRLLQKLREDAMDSDYLLYNRIAEHLPLPHAKTLVLLKGYMAFEINDCYVIDESVEDDIVSFTKPLMVRYSELRKASRLEEAVGILAAIALAIEPQYGNVADEGIAFHTLLEEVFDEMDSVVALLAKSKAEIKQQLARALHGQVIGYYEQLNPEEQFYEDRWKNVIEKLRKTIKW